MSKAIENLEGAQKQAMAIRPKVGGFPYLAETLRRAGVTRNTWTLPACQALYLTKDGPVAMMFAPLLSGSSDVPAFNRDALIRACGSIRAGIAPSMSSSNPLGGPASSASTSISRHEPSATTAATAIST